jgi:hypothetical protein
VAWPTRLVAVPTEQLKQGEQLAPSAKATSAQMRSYMAIVPVVYDRIGAGARAEDFQRMRASRDPRSRAMGEAYHHLFSTAGVDHRLEAEVVEGKGLVVTRGRHRVEAAREIGLPYLPVHVRAADDRILDAATQSIEEHLRRAAPEVVIAHRELDAEHRASRPATAERTGSPGAVSRGGNDRALRTTNAASDRFSSGPSRDRGRS